MIQLASSTLLNRPIQVRCGVKQVFIVSLSRLMVLNSFLNRGNLERLHLVLFVPVESKQSASLVQELVHVYTKLLFRLHDVVLCRTNLRLGHSIMILVIYVEWGE